MRHKTIGDLLKENHLTINEVHNLLEKYCYNCKYHAESTKKIMGLEFEGGFYCVKNGFSATLPSIIKCKGEWYDEKKMLQTLSFLQEKKRIL